MWPGPLQRLNSVKPRRAWFAAQVKTGRSPVPLLVIQPTGVVRCVLAYKAVTSDFWIIHV